MKLEQQVTSLELSKRLRELGVKQDSVFYWGSMAAGLKPVLWREHEVDKRTIHHKYLDYSAFTVAELGEMLQKSKYAVIKQFDGGCYFFKQHENTTLEYGMIAGRGFSPEKTEADARAKMLIYLLENKLIN